MTGKSNNIKKASIALTIILISLVTIVPIVTNLFNQTTFRTNTTNTIIDQIPSQSPLPTSLTVINETKKQNADNFSGNLSSSSTDTVPTYTETSKSTSNIQAELTRCFFTLSNSPITSITTVPISLNASNFVTYTYYGYPVQQPDSAQFFFSFPDKTNQDQIAGSDAFSCDTFAIQKMEFDAVFNTPKTSALGFDEMVIFATSDPISYKGIEFGIRMDLSDGFIYGYVQEPNGNYGEVTFQMLKLMSNDGIMHHFTVFILGSEVSFFIDGVSYGHLNFSSNTEYSTLSFSILAVVHRFTDDWDSTGDNMTVENFLLNQP